MASEIVKQFTDGNFDSEVLQSKQPVLVDFWAPWCQPCLMLAPTIDALASDFNGKAKIGKLDIDSNRNITMKYNINSIPTILIFKDGQPVKRLAGFRKKEDFINALAEAGVK
jgi:thioredoxin 1